MYIFLHDSFWFTISLIRCQMRLASRDWMLLFLQCREISIEQKLMRRGSLLLSFLSLGTIESFMNVGVILNKLNNFVEGLVTHSVLLEKLILIEPRKLLTVYQFHNRQDVLRVDTSDSIFIMVLLEHGIEWTRPLRGYGDVQVLVEGVLNGNPLRRSCTNYFKSQALVENSRGGLLIRFARCDCRGIVAHVLFFMWWLRGVSSCFVVRLVWRAESLRSASASARQIAPDA